MAEQNANLLFAPSIQVPAGFAAARNALSELRPAYLRVDVDWAALEPAPGRLELQRTDPGCLRGIAPCGPYHGIADELRAISSQQRSGGGFEPIVVIYGVPGWAAAPPAGCAAGKAGPLSRPVTAGGLAAYRGLVASLIALGRREGVNLRWWSPWDEPNHPFFISPQRERCATGSPAVAPVIYTQLAAAMEQALRAAGGGDRHLLLGDLADFPRPRVDGASIAEFVSALPQSLVCAAGAWAVHEYPKAGAPGATPGGVRALEQALDARGPCGRRAHIWVTETGAGNPHGGQPRATTAAGAAADCRLLATALTTWYRDPRVDVAIQYTFRQDTQFQVGLATTTLDGLYPPYYLLRAWGGGRPATAPPPEPPAQCR